jgi:redox-sensitive bicupin YhaK (pirin superfamily)
VIARGEIQVMSAGTGIFHSEFSDPQLTTKLLQIWVFPKLLSVKPRYDQKVFLLVERKDRFQLIVSNDGRANSLTINQDAFFSIAEVSQDETLHYSPYIASSGAYLFIMSGAFEINGQVFHAKDGIGLESFKTISFKALNQSSEILVMELPMLKS